MDTAEAAGSSGWDKSPVASSWRISEQFNEIPQFDDETPEWEFSRWSSAEAQHWVYAEGERERHPPGCDKAVKMKTTIVPAMKCELAQEGMLRIDRISAGVGILIFSRMRRVAVGLHVLRGVSGGREADHPVYFVDTAIPYALELLEETGAHPPYSVALAGGASLLGGGRKFGKGTGLVEDVREHLGRANLRVKLEETGGNTVRSMLLNIDLGKIKIA